MLKKISNEKDRSPWSTSSQEIGSHSKLKTGQEVKEVKEVKAKSGGESNLAKFVRGESGPSRVDFTAPKRPEGSLAQFVRGESGPSYFDSSYEELSGLADLNSVATSRFFDKRRHAPNGEASSEEPKGGQKEYQPNNSVKGKGASSLSLAEDRPVSYKGK